MGTMMGKTPDSCLSSFYLVKINGHPLRHCLLDKRSLPLRRVARKPNIRGLFAPDLLTGLGAEGAQRLSLRPILSKAVDCRI
jgi:hypothetical protein